MKFKILMLVAFLCPNVTIGQNIVEDIVYYEDGKIQSKKTYDVDEMTNLTCEAYFRNGKIASKSIISFDGTLTNYDYKEYFENGQLAKAGLGSNYRNYREMNEIPGYVNNEFLELEYSTPSPEIKDGRWVKHYENGQLEYDAFYENNLQIGEWITYYENGQIESKGEYEEGEKTGEWITYYENGQMQSKKMY